MLPPLSPPRGRADFDEELTILYTEDGRLEIDNNNSERTVRLCAISRKKGYREGSCNRAQEMARRLREQDEGSLFVAECGDLAGEHGHRDTRGR
jgi:hypothetical protein